MSTELRDQAAMLASQDTGNAEAVAKRIEDPWYRAQALAWVLRYAPRREIERLAQRAMDAAAACDDPYQQAGSAAWTIRALLERGQRDLALTMLEIALTAVPRITQSSSRSDALFLLYQAGFDASDEVRRSLLFAIAEMRDRDPHWRVVRNFEDALGMSAKRDPELVRKLASAADEKTRRRIEARLDEEPPEPRPFFW
ncbi:MAG: hypothetical protein KDB80_02230 [Planctomycetes bacterium]|nr:hypothetical protein [Planctomycetota bacterium]